MIIIITLIPVTIFAKVLYRACQATSHLCGQHSNSFLDNLKNYPYMCNVWLLRKLVVSYGTTYDAVQGGSNFGIRG